MIIYIIVAAIKFLVPDVPNEIWRKLKDERDSFITRKDCMQLIHCMLIDIKKSDESSLDNVIYEYTGVNNSIKQMSCLVVSFLVINI